MESVVASAPATGHLSRARRIAFYTCAVLLLALFSADFALHALDFANPHHIHVALHEIFSGMAIASLLSQLIASRRFVAGAQALLVLFAAGWLFDALTLRFSGIGVFLLLGVAVAALHPLRGAVFSLRGRVRPTLALVSVLGALPLTVYALQQAANQRDNFAPVHASLGHWEWAATAAALIFLFGWLAALGTAGFRLPAWCAGLSAATFGLASILYPGEASAVGALWGVVALVGSALFIALAEWEARRAGNAA
ncbi:MAG TPA: hypothetical protein VGR57_06870 [Ktedonobacterales bacterium]|nr:hypothetical protein [Ktedonobacterales bacterium]